MKLSKPYRLWMLLVVLVLSSSATSAGQKDPLPSWADTDAKQSIVAFVAKVTDAGSPDFVPIPERIATFDNDGTLWSEKPMYFQVFFVVDRVRQLAPDHPDWKTKEPFASILKGDLEKAFAGGEKAIVEALMATHAGMSTDAFATLVSDWITTARHPESKRLFTDMVFQPMLELLDFLRANDFTTYIVSGGGIEFMRPWTERVYGIPPQQVVGSSIKTEFKMGPHGPQLMRLPAIDFIDDKVGKPVGIFRYIGQRPILAAGNSDGDLQMLQYTTMATDKKDKTPRLGLIIHHTDDQREFAYDRQSSVGKLDQALDEAPQRGWLVVDMKSDWKRVYP